MNNSAIRTLYDNYINFYHKLLDPSLPLTRKEIKEVKHIFHTFFTNTKLLPEDLASNSRYSKLYLKYFTFNCVFQQMPSSSFMKTPNNIISMWNKYTFPIKSLLSNWSMHKNIKKWGFKSVMDAFSVIFDFDIEETMNQMDLFLEKSKEEYYSLLKEHIHYVRISSDSNSQRNEPIFLSDHEKQQIYNGQWLSDKFRNADLNKISFNLRHYFLEHQYLTEETDSIIEQKIVTSQTGNLFYENITMPKIDWRTNSVTKYTINNFIQLSKPYIQKALIHEIGHVITLSNLPKSDDLFTYIPFESAVNELGGEFFEILYVFPDFIAEIYNITDKNECDKISKYFRLYDLISKRYMAILFKNYTYVLQNQKFVNFNSKSVHNRIKCSIRKELSLKPSKNPIFSINMIHQLDYIRGLILIQEPYYHICKNHSNKYSTFQKNMVFFSRQLFFNPFGQIQQYFCSNTEKIHRKKGSNIQIQSVISEIESNSYN